ncbi:MAG TPA: proprotein convertase P-domain-containing protein [Rudaea sp.]
MNLRHAVLLGLVCTFLFQQDIKAATFTGTGVGAIPDGASTAVCNITSIGTPLAITFNVSGLTTPIENVGVEIELTHSSVGDLHAVLVAPNDAKVTLFGDTGQPAASGAANVSGPYFFADNQTGNWWSAAAANGSGTIPAGGYRSSGEATSAYTSFNTTFKDMAPAQANGTWVLKIADDCNGDVGSVTSAELRINDASLPVRLQSYDVD